MYKSVCRPDLIPIADALKEYGRDRIKYRSIAEGRLLAEKVFGGGKACANFIYVHFGARVAASISNMKSFRHPGYITTGELAHARYFSDKLCLCGRTGCLETVVSARAIKEFIEARAEASDGNILKKVAGCSLAEVMDIFLDLCVKGDQKECREYLAAMSRALAVAIRNVVDLLTPEKVIIGGPFLRAAEIIIPVIREEMNITGIEERPREIPLEVSDIGESIDAIGAATLLLDEKFQFTSS